MKHLGDHLRVHDIDLHSLFKVKIGNGENTRFWIDKWVGDTPLSTVFPRLFRLETWPLCRVCDRSPVSNSSPASVLTSVPADGLIVSEPTIPSQYDPPGLRFRWAWSRDLRTSDSNELIELQSLLCNLQVTSDQDKWECLIESSRIFFVKGWENFSGVLLLYLPRTQQDRIS